MAQAKALFLETPVNGQFRVRPKAISEPGPGELLVKIQATALNPVDWKIRAKNFIVSEYPAILGSDSTGTVEAVGEGVQGFAKGDRVLHQGGFTHKSSAYQQYSVIAAEIAAKLPSNISFDEAASVPSALATAAVGLYGDRPEGVQKYKPGWEEGGKGLYDGQPIIVSSGSSSVGQYAIQLAKLSGFSPIITVASAHNKEYLLSLGATHVVDRTAKDVPGQIAQALGGAPVKIIYDTVSEEDTQTQAWELLSSGGQLVLLLPPKVDQEKYKDKTFVEVEGNVHFPAARPLGVSLYSKLTKLLEDGSIKPNRVEVIPGGLAGIPEGLERLKSGKVSGKKLVAHPQA